MSTDANVNTTPNAGISGDVRLTGRVKWFNNRAGFGFVTVLEGDKKDEDIFVHHSGIVVSSEQYKYLVQGEYVNFSLRESDSEEHPYQAGNVRGVMEGVLMCETRYANRSQRTGDDEGDSSEQQSDRRRGPRRNARRSRAPRRTGGSKDSGSDDWELNRRGGGSSSASQSS